MNSSRATTMKNVRQYSLAIAVIAVLAAVAIILRRSPVQEASKPTGDVPMAVTTTETFPTTEEIQKNWPCFRGPGGLGVAANATLPPAWDAQPGSGVLWKSPIPFDGNSSPVVWGKDVFITGATSEESRVLCYDADTGNLRWSSVVKAAEGNRSPAHQPKEGAGLAAPTPVTDGHRVYAIFPTGEVAAFNLTGKQLWARNIGPLKSAYGYASSLCLHQDHLLLQLDLSKPAKSKMLALDTQTGKELWQTPRPMGPSWSSPILTEYGKQLQIITCANPFVIGYDPANGKELWRLEALDGDIAPTPIIVGKNIIAISSTVQALQAGVKDPAWTYTDCVPDITSPVSDGKYVYLLSTGGDLRCLDAQTGNEVWAHDLGEKFSASPVLIGHTLLLLSEKGTAFLVATGDCYQELGQREIDDDCIASPAPVGSRLYIRGKSNLFCIGK